MNSETLNNRQHRENYPLIADYAAGALEGRRLQRFALHLASCPVCQREAQAHWRMQAALEHQLRDRVDAEQPTPQFTSRLLTAVRRAPAPHNGLTTRVRQRMSARMPGLPPRRVMMSGAVAMALVLWMGVAGVWLSMRPSEVLALSLETPVRGTFTVTSEVPIVTGNFEYASADQWRRDMTLFLLPPGEREIEELQAGGARYQRFNADDPWEKLGSVPAEFGPFPGLAEFGPPARLFDALLQLHKLERKATSTLDGQSVILYEGRDKGYAARLKQRLGGVVDQQYLEERYRWYTQYPPRVWLYADDEKHIVSVVLIVLAPEATQPTVTSIKITEMNADVRITPP